MPYRQKRKKSSRSDRRLQILPVGFGVFLLLILARLFWLQVIQHESYAKEAKEKHSFTRELLPVRGRIFFQDLKKPEQLFPLAINQEIFQVVADPKMIDNPHQAAYILSKKLGVDEMELAAKLSKKNSRYEVVKKQVGRETIEELKLEKLPGLFFESKQLRFYPEKNLASQTVGFYGFNKEGDALGRYGLEGYFNETLGGQAGYAAGERDAQGAWLLLTEREIKKPIDGADLVLTIDRTIESAVCQKLAEGMREYKATGGTAIILNPKTGAILALCNETDFDPNKYYETANVNLFNNNAIFTPYEPGSVFKAFTMAAALDLGLVTPETKYLDRGFVKIGDIPIKNAADKVYGEQTMTGVIKESINTGAVFAAQKVGREMFKKYVQNFGFGLLTGIELETEAAGNISSLDKKSEIYLATASFGQGLTATSLQLVSAFGAIANQGKLFKPYLISEIRYADGRIEKREPQLIRQVISPRTARLLSGMLATVVNEGHGRRAKVDGYILAGKTGTAQIPNPHARGYLESTIQTFIGFGPLDDPIFAMIVKYDEPERLFAEYSAVPTFGEIAKFLLQYLEIPPNP